jgi:hypothetical protein
MEQDADPDLASFHRPGDILERHLYGIAQPEDFVFSRLQGPGEEPDVPGMPGFFLPDQSFLGTG